MDREQVHNISTPLFLLIVSKKQPKRSQLNQQHHPDNRIGSAEFTLPPGTSGPPAHWHEMHDETFLVTQGTVRFHAPDNTHVDAATGDYVTVPIRAPHTFSNPFEEEAKFFNTFTPAFYIDYFKILAKISESDEKMSREKNLEVMARFATVEAREMVEEGKGGKGKGQ
jgi:mannose-6-phosphate isomerase-like protein (cupin superfamily)